MKKYVGQLISISAAFTLMNFTGSVYAYGNFGVSAESVYISGGERLSMPQNDNISFAYPEFKSLIGQDVDDLSELSPVAHYSAIDDEISVYGNDAESLPDSFDMRDEGMITSVKNQGSYGTCWTFSSVASAETSLIDLVPDIDLSEWHTAYYPYTGGNQIDIGAETVNEHLQYGGTINVVANLWAQWIGPVSEEKLPYGDELLFEDEEITSEYADAADYHLENAYMFDFEKDGSNRESVNSLVKQFVYEGHAVDVSFSTKGYSYGTNSCYSETKSKYANHSVTIAGWDDNYTDENLDGHTGAWLCRNSWGIGFGDNGYFWIAYDDTSLCEFAVFELESAENYSENYQHDSFVPTQTMSAYDEEDADGPSYMANVFTADEDSQLEAVATYINNPNTEYEVTIYTGLKNISVPSSGKASAVTKGSSELTGYITIELDEDVPLKAGESFAVVVKMYCESSSYVLPLETCMLLVDPETGAQTPLGKYTTYEKICEYTGTNESFYSEDGKDWIDVTEENFEYTEEEKNEILEQVIEENDDMTEEQISAYRKLFDGKDLVVVMGNMSLKAFANPVNTVDFSHPSGNVPTNEAVELSAKDGSDIYYSVNGGQEQLYTTPISITEDMEISATSDHKNYTVRSYTPAESEFTSLGYFTSLKYMSVEKILYANKEDSHTYNIEVSGAESSIKFFPISAADVYVDGQQLEINEFSTSFALDYGQNVFEFRLSQDNRLDNTVTVNVFRNPVKIDLESEIITFANADVTAEDGTVINSGDSVSEYAGQTLTALINGETVEISVPERAELPELELDYYNETLNFLPNEIAEQTVYAVGENPDDSDFISVEERCIDGQNITSGMVMNKAFRIIPGETVTLKIRPGDGKFGSEEKVYEIPEVPEAPAEEPDYISGDGKYYLNYNEVLEYGVIENPITEDEFSVLAEQFGYGCEAYEELMMARYGVNSHDELLRIMGAEWDAVFELDAETDNSEIAVRYYSSDNKFASAGYLYVLKYMEQNGAVSSVLKGDMNMDGKIDALDASLVLTYYAEVSTGLSPEISEEQAEAADYNSDRAIDALDASEILTYYAKKATEKF